MAQEISHTTRLETAVTVKNHIFKSFRFEFVRLGVYQPECECGGQDVPTVALVKYLERPSRNLRPRGRIFHDYYSSTGVVASPGYKISYLPARHYPPVYHTGSVTVTVVQVSAAQGLGAQGFKF